MARSCRRVQPSVRLRRVYLVGREEEILVGREEVILVERKVEILVGRGDSRGES